MKKKDWFILLEQCWGLHWSLGPIKKRVSGMMYSYPEWKSLRNKEERMFYIVARRMGLLGDKPTSQASIGTDLGISASRVKQIENKAYRRYKYAVSKFKECDLPAAIPFFLNTY